jgi:hypothetical protein
MTTEAATALASTECAPATHIGRDAPPQGELMVNAATTCSEAQFAIEEGGLSRSGNLIPGARGWKCHVRHHYHSGGVTLGAKIICRRPVHQAFSFSWST